jgi:capsular exopolysaccharide synthesis family protein
MRPFDYLRILARRWWILVLGALIGSLLAFVTAPSSATVLKTTAPKVQFRATNLMLADPTSTSRIASGLGYDRLALLTINGAVRDDAIAKLHATRLVTATGKQQLDSASSSGASDTTSSKQKAAQKAAADSFFPNFSLGAGRVALLRKDGLVIVAPVPDPSTGALKITATGSKSFAVEAANTFATSLQSYLDNLGKQRFDAQVAAKTADLTLAQQAITSYDARIALELDPIKKNQLTLQQADAVKKRDSLQSDINGLKLTGAPKSELVTYEPASDSQLEVISAPGGSTLSSSQRLLVGGGIGLLAGLALLVLMELLGARVRDVASTEGAARMPVIAEIPVVKMNRADRFMVATASDPASLTAEAYRSLRTSLLAMWQRHPRNTPLPGTDPAATGQRGRPLRTLLVTSPGPAEGKSISVVNLAAAFAETGMTVLIVDADFRRPTQYRYLERPRDPNLGDLDISCSAEDLEAILQDTEIPGVRLAASAPSKADPGHAIAVAKAAARVGTEFADLVIVDSPPLLLANDASDIALDVDASILLARAGWTRRSGIVASADLLRRLEAPVIGVVIVGAEHGVRAGYYGYYGYYGYGYGYAHPGEVSVMQRLMPWKAGRKSSSGAGTRPRPTPSAPANPGREREPSAPTATIDPPRPPAPPVPPTPPVVDDDPWV